ncbi:MAG: sensor histidine kinase [Lachnospiraceae bacterium]|nr:sensor histidine kinase [Lachnospiraceae bacterium]
MGNLEKSKAGSLSSIKHRKPLWATRCLRRLFLWRQPLLLIEQVIINLLENAIVHSGSKLPVELTVVCGEKQVSFHVRDYGVGISPDRLETIFGGSSYRPESSTDGHKGMGIGYRMAEGD